MKLTLEKDYNKYCFLLSKAHNYMLIYWTQKKFINILIKMYMIEI